MYVVVKHPQPRRERNLLLDPSIVIKVIDIAHTLYFFSLIMVEVENTFILGEHTKEMLRAMLEHIGILI